MLAELIDFVDSVLPAVDPDFREGAINAITQFEFKGKKPKFLTLNPLDKLSQGDVLSGILFWYTDKNGEQKVMKTDAMVISTSCHIDNRETLTFVPVNPISEYTEKNIVDLTKNRIFDYMVIPDGVMNDKFVDFHIMYTYSKDVIMKAIEQGKVKRLCSLNQLGYYLFVIKMTVFFMKKEDQETLDDRNIGYIEQVIS